MTLEKRVRVLTVVLAVDLAVLAFALLRVAAVAP